MWVAERQIEAKLGSTGDDLFDRLSAILSTELGDDEILLRYVVTELSAAHVAIEALVLTGAESFGFKRPLSPLHLVRRVFEDSQTFNAVLVIPTGIGAEIGGHAGDAGPVAKLLCSVCDTVVTHPNVVNASDINELPANGIYVEGSVLTRLLMGTASLQRARGNRVLVVIDDHPDEYFSAGAINAIGAARATYGLNCPYILKLDKGVRLRAFYSESGRAIGEVTGLELLLPYLRQKREEYDAVAISSVINVPPAFHQQYFEAGGHMVNPWGGVEAMLTHTLSALLDVPSAHSPMFEAREIANYDPGIVDPRMSAEAVSFTFLQCILKGLQCSPRIVSMAPLGCAGLFDVTNVSCLVIPQGCLGPPTFAALAQGITVIAVRENTSLMKNDLRQLPWRSGQFFEVENYLEAAGLIAALRSGIAPSSVRRPLAPTRTLSLGAELAPTSGGDKPKVNYELGRVDN
jgi:hypothetical protein